MNDLCEKPLQSATNMLKHMAAHNAARAFATAARVIGSGSAPTIVTSTFVSTFPAEQLPVEPVLAASLATTDIAMVADESRGEAAEPTA